MVRKFDQVFLLLNQLTNTYLNYDECPSQVLQNNNCYQIWRQNPNRPKRNEKNVAESRQICSETSTKILSASKTNFSRLGRPGPKKLLPSRLSILKVRNSILILTLKEEQGERRSPPCRSNTKIHNRQVMVLLIPSRCWARPEPFSRSHCRWSWRQTDSEMQRFADFLSGRSASLSHLRTSQTLCGDLCTVSSPGGIRLPGAEYILSCCCGSSWPGFVGPSELDEVSKKGTAGVVYNSRCARFKNVLLSCRFIFQNAWKAGVFDVVLSRPVNGVQMFVIEFVLYLTAFVAVCYVIVWAITYSTSPRVWGSVFGDLSRYWAWFRDLLGSSSNWVPLVDFVPLLCASVPTQFIGGYEREICYSTCPAVFVCGPKAGRPKISLWLWLPKFCNFHACFIITSKPSQRCQPWTYSFHATGCAVVRKAIKGIHLPPGMGNMARTAPCNT